MSYVKRVIFRKVNSMNKINVIHILQSLEIGGMENGVVNLLNGLSRESFTPLLCCLEKEGPLRVRLSNDIKLFNLNQKEGLHPLLPLRLAKIIQQENVQIVHTHNFGTAIYGIIGGRLARVPVIIHGEHGMIAQEKPRRRIIAKYLYKKADAIISVSEDLKKILVNNIGIKSENIETILNGVDIGRFSVNSDLSKVREELGILPTDLVVGTVGRMVPIKNQASLIRSFSEVLKHIPGAKLLLIGDGPLRSKLEEIALSIVAKSSIVFAGQRDDVDKVLKIMHIFVLPSLSEGMSNVILEAMAAGLPVIASNVGDNNKLVKNNDTGKILDSLDIQDISNAIIDLLSNKEKAKKMGARGKEYVVQHYSLDKMVKEYEEMYLAHMKRIGN